MPGLPSIQLFDGMFRGLETALDVRRTQHTLIASNLANADTPNYKAKVIPFQDLLQDVMDRSLRGEQVDGAEAANQAVTEVEPLPWSLDGNSVVAEQQTVELTENSVMYQALSAGIGKRLAILRFAASDGKA